MEDEQNRNILSKVWKTISKIPKPKQQKVVQQQKVVKPFPQHNLLSTTTSALKKEQQVTQQLVNSRLYKKVSDLQIENIKEARSQVVEKEKAKDVVKALEAFGFLFSFVFGFCFAFMVVIFAANFSKK